MTYNSSIEFKLVFPCDVVSGLDDLESELDEVLYTPLVNSHFGDYDFGGNIVFSVDDAYSILDEYTIVLKINADLPIEPGDDLDEDDFIEEFKEAFEGYKKYLVEQINDILEGSDLFGRIPEKIDMVYQDNHMYVEVDRYGSSSSMKISFAPAYVEDDEDSEDQLSDLYNS